MKQTRSQKKRNVNDATIQFKQLSDYYTNVVNSYFLFGDWIKAMTPKYEDSRLDGAVKMFIVQTMMYFNIFTSMYKGKKCIIVSKKDVIKAIKDNDIFDNIQYDETYTKEAVMNVLDKGLELFFNNSIFPFVDKDELKEEEIKLVQ